jgi:hypothetical protein
MTVNVTLTFPETVLERIDRERGEIKRSTYVIKLLQQTYQKQLEENDSVTSRQSKRRPLRTTPKVEGHLEQSPIVSTKTTLVECDFDT